MSKFQIKIEDSKPEISLPKKKEPLRGQYGVYLSMSKNEREEQVQKIIKMFRAACNGKNYYKKWFPEYKDTGDFAAGFASEVYKLIRK